MSKLDTSDLFYVVASSLVCLFLFFSVIMPKVRANMTTQRKLNNVVLETESLLLSSRKAEKLTWSLEDNDPWVVKNIRRKYLPITVEPEGPEPKEQKDEETITDAGHSESR